MTSRAACSWWACGVAMVLLFTCGRLRAAPLAKDVPALAWRAPAAAFRASWHRGPDFEGIEAVATDEDVPLGTQDSLVVPVRPGDRLRVQGGNFCLWLGFGAEVADGATRMACGEAARELRVASYSSARYAIVQPREPGAFRVFLAQPPEDPMAWYRANEDVWRWLVRGREGTPPLGSMPRPDLRESLELLEALRAVGRGPGAPTLPDEYLAAVWLDSTREDRPLHRPFFHSLPVDVRAEAGPEPLGSSEDGLLVEAGRCIQLISPGAEVQTLVIEGDAERENRLAVFDGVRLVARKRIRLSRASARARSWSIPSIVRTGPVTGRLRLCVESGRFRVRVSAYGVKRGLLGPSIHGRRSLLRRAVHRSGPELAKIILARLSPSRSRVDELRRDIGTMASPLRVVVWFELVRLEGSLQAKMAALERLATLSVQELEPPHAAALVSFGLDEVLRAGAESEDVAPVAHAIFAPSLLEGASHAAEALRLRRIQLAPPATGQRSLALANAELHHLDLAYDDRQLARLRRAWQRGASWSTMSVVSAHRTHTRFLVPRPEGGEGPCDVQTASGSLRWTVLPPNSDRSFDLTGGDEGYVPVPVRPLTIPASEDGWLLVDGVRIPIHTGAAEGGLFAATWGRHQVAWQRGPPLALKLPRSGKVPCEELRIVQEWAIVGESARFELPAGAGWTVARLRVDPDSLEAQSARVEVEAGNQSHVLVIGGKATGAPEFRVPQGATELTVRSSRPLWLRVQARRLPRPSAPIRRTNPWYPREAFDEEALLERLRQTTRELRAADAALEHGLIKRLRARRAAILSRLGYQSFADRDLELGGMGAIELGASEAGPPALPLGRLGKIDVLPAVDDLSPIRRAVTLRERGATSRSAVALLEEAFADAPATTGTLMLALWAEDAGDFVLAAHAFQRLGTDLQQPEAFEQAAHLLLREAELRGGVEGTRLATQSLLQAVRAHRLDGRLPPVLGRLSEVLTWVSAPSDAGAGAVWLDVSRFDEKASKAVRVRRALIDARPEARMFRTDRMRLDLDRFDAAALRLQAGCHALEGAHEPCTLVVRVDGRRTDCLTETPVTSKGPPTGELRQSDGGVAKLAQCSLSLPRGAGRVTVALPRSKEAIGWAEVRVGESETDLSLEGGAGEIAARRERWTLVDADHPFEVVLASPTALRLLVRPSEARQQLRVVTEAEVQHIELPDLPLSASALVGGPSRPLRVPSTQYVAVPGEGAQTVTISSAAPLLLRLDAAVVAGAPEPEVPAPPDEELGESPAMGLPSFRPPATSWDPRPGPMTLGAQLSHQWPVLNESDQAARDQFVEIRPYVAREIAESWVWAELAALTRLRDGPASFGAEGLVSVASRDGLPGGYLRGRVVGQSFEDLVWGGHLTAAIVYGLRVAPEWKLLPVVTYTERLAADRPAFGGVDLDVWSRYAQTRPRTLDAQLNVDHRPFVDTLLRLSSTVRWGPELRGIDRIEWETNVRTLPGRGWTPLLDLQLGLSYRPESPQRQFPFTRFNLGTDVLLWRWLRPDWRVLFGAYAGYSLDFPFDRGAGSQFSAGLSLATEFNFGRGLQDSRLFLRPHRSRLEEGAWPIERAQSRSGSDLEEDYGSQ